MRMLRKSEKPRKSPEEYLNKVHLSSPVRASIIPSGRGKHKLHAVLQAKEYPPNRPYEVTETDTDAIFTPKTGAFKRIAEAGGSH